MSKHAQGRAQSSIKSLKLTLFWKDGQVVMVWKDTLIGEWGSGTNLIT